jgi:hypothetical protein
LVSPTSAAKPQQQPDPATGQYPSSKTVKSLLDSSRQQKIVPGISTATMVPVYPASGIPKVGQQQFIMVTSAPSIATTTKTNIPTTTVTNAKPQSKIIDLTDEEENAAKQVVPQVTKMAPIPTVVSGIQPQGLIRNITPQQGALPHKSILLSGPGGTRFVNPGQQQYQLVFNSGTPNIRPGSLVTVVTAPGAPGLRPAVSQTPVLPPPQLRATQLVPLTSLPKTNVAVTSVATGMPQVRTVRPPPPLLSAPTSQNNQTVSRYRVCNFYTSPKINVGGAAYSLPKTMQNVENISFVSQRSLFSNVIANNNQHKVKTDFGDDASTVLKLAPLKLSKILVFDITYQPYIAVAHLSYHDYSKA